MVEWLFFDGDGLLIECCISAIPVVLLIVYLGTPDPIRMDGLQLSISLFIHLCLFLYPLFFIQLIIYLSVYLSIILHFFIHLPVSRPFYLSIILHSINQ